MIAKVSLDKKVKKLATLFIVLGAAFLSCFLLAPSSQATLMTGSINFSSQVQYDTGNVNTADAIAKWGKARVEGVDGTFAALTRGTSVSVSASWNFDPSAPLSSLWNVGGFTFDLLTSTIVNQGGGLLTLTGTGLVKSGDPSFDATSGRWTFTSQDGTLRNGSFTFSADSTTVSDGGSALALLGLSLVGVGLLRRKLASV